MKWIWQQSNWPQFEFDLDELREFEDIFLQNIGALKGTITHLSAEDEDNIQIEVLLQEAIQEK